jgi:hypothetical protein
MTVTEALEMMDVASGQLKSEASVIYPGLNTLQAMRYVAEGFVASIATKKPDELKILNVHPHVRERIIQVCANKIGGGPKPDATIATLYFMGHPDEAPPLPPPPPDFNKYPHLLMPKAQSAKAPMLLFSEWEDPAANSWATPKPTSPAMDVHELGIEDLGTHTHGQDSHQPEPPQPQPEPEPEPPPLPPAKPYTRKFS